MTLRDTAIALTASNAGTGPVTLAASAPLFSPSDVGRLIALYHQAPERQASQAYSAGAVFYASYAGVTRLYRVTQGGTTAAYSSAETTPDYDINAPHEVGTSITDGTAKLKYLGSGKHCWGFGGIVEYTSPTRVLMAVHPRGPLVGTEATLRWRLGAWSDALGWPKCVTFHSGRLWWGGSKDLPQTVWASEAADFEGYSPTDPDGTVLDTHAMTFSLDDDTVNTIRWMSSSARGLAIGGASGEFMVAPASSTGALSPSNTKAVRAGDRGSHPGLPHHRVTGGVLFVQRGGRCLRELTYDYATDTYASTDLTLLADHIAGLGFVETAMQQQPAGYLWALRADGVLACLTYDREQKVRAWTRHIPGGAGARVESIAVVPGPDGTDDDLYLQVVRTINGQAVRQIEVMPAPFRSELSHPSGWHFTDCTLTHRGDPVSAVGGLEPLEGETVHIVADDAVRQPQVVRNGRVAISGPPARAVHVGLPVTADLRTLPMEAGAANGTAQGRPKKITHITFRLLETGTLRYGTDGAMEELPRRHPYDPMGLGVPLITGEVRMAWPGDWGPSATIFIQATDPLPCTVLAVIPEVQTNG